MDRIRLISKICFLAVIISLPAHASLRGCFTKLAKLVNSKRERRLEYLNSFQGKKISEQDYRKLVSIRDRDSSVELQNKAEDILVKSMNFLEQKEKITAQDYDFLKSVFHEDLSLKMHDKRRAILEKYLYSLLDKEVLAEDYALLTQITESDPSKELRYHAKNILSLASFNELLKTKGLRGGSTQRLGYLNQLMAHPETSDKEQAALNRIRKFDPSPEVRDYAHRILLLSELSY